MEPKFVNGVSMSSAADRDVMLLTFTANYPELDNSVTTGIVGRFIMTTRQAEAIRDMLNQILENQPQKKE